MRRLSLARERQESLLSTEQGTHQKLKKRQYCKNNRERLNEYWKSYYAKNKEQINQRRRDQRQRNIGARDQESEKLETSPPVNISSETQHGVLLKDFAEETVFKVLMFDCSILDTFLHLLSYLIPTKLVTNSPFGIIQ